MEAKETDMQIKEKDLLILDSYFLNNSYIDKFSPSKADLYLHKLINSNITIMPDLGKKTLPLEKSNSEANKDSG
ncbi:hypothetical protein Avbf_09215 [Armadillidium vulgare]|nr:hypothetical protein Avbf_09215 [Armadillidium vulgare]